MQHLQIPSDVEKMENIQFRVDSGYEWGKGGDPDRIAAFNMEIKKFVFPVLEKRGWQYNPRDGISCATMTKNGREVYIHPMELTAVCDKEEGKAIEDVLKNHAFLSFRYMGRSERSTEIYDCSIEKVQEIYQQNKDNMKENIMEILEREVVSRNSLWEEMERNFLIRSTGERNFHGWSSDDSCSKMLDTCLKEMEEKDRILEQDSYMIRKCTRHKEPYFLTRWIHKKDGTRQLSAVVKTKDCIPVLILPYFKEKRELALSTEKKVKDRMNMTKTFIKEHKKEIEGLADGKSGPLLIKKKKELTEKWNLYRDGKTIECGR